MKARTQDVTRPTTRSTASRVTLRPVDGFVVGGAAEWSSAQNLWLLLSRPGERLIDFFMDDDEQGGSCADPVTCACAGVLPDGTVLIGEVDWEMDRFLSEVLDEQEAVSERR